MRALLILFGLLAALPAWADAKLLLTADRPVVIVVNLVPHPVGDQSPVTIDIPRGKEGTQRVTVRNLAGQQMYQGTLVVEAGTVVTARWSNKMLEVTDRKILKNATTRGSTPKRQAGHKQLDKIAERSDEGAGDLLSLAASSTVSAAPDEPTDPEDDTALDSEPIDEAPLAPAVAEVAEGTGSGSGNKPGKGSSETVLRFELAADQADAATVKLVPRSQSWANVWIGDQRVWEYRGKADAMLVSLAPGLHSVSFKDFRDVSDWGSGTLMVTAGQSAELHFSMSQPVEAVGGDWKPAK